MKIPILYGDFSSYIRARQKHGRMMYAESSSRKLRSLIKKAMSGRTSHDDKSTHEQHWAGVYARSRSTKFYSVMRREVSKLSGRAALEHGCSVGHVTRELAKNHDVAFGIDRSFAALRQAKSSCVSNLDFFAADSLRHPFAAQRFDTLLALNLLEIIEPDDLIDVLSRQLRGTVIISDPYDNDRGALSVSSPVDEHSLRQKMLKHNLKLSSGTARPGFVTWNLAINRRTAVHYKTDIIIATR